MFPRALERGIQNLVLICALSTTLIILPWWTLEPISLPKLFTLGTFGFVAIGILLPYLKQIINSDARYLTYAVLLFLTSLVIVLFMSRSGIWPQVYGDFGRNTGLIAYFSLAVLLLLVVFISNADFARSLIQVLIITGMINAIYGIIQWSGNDPIAWINPYNPILGTLGNPNFISAHLGVAGLASLALAFESTKPFMPRLILMVNIGLSLFVIIQSNSSQGLFIFALGMILILYFRFLSSLHLIIRVGYWLLVIFASFFVTGGILNRGPLKTILFQESILFRVDYWRAGWKMTLDNPLFGVGMDSYGAWYRFSRTEAATLRRGPDVVSNSAHNTFLDISSNGGFLLLATYSLILGLVARSAIRILSSSKVFDAIGIGLVTSWVAYVLQSLVSINQLALAIWGWVLGGGIIGYDRYKTGLTLPSHKGRARDQSVLEPPRVVLTAISGFIIGLAILIWPLAQDISFRDALKSQNAIRIESATEQFPRGAYFYINAGRIFYENKLYEKALEMARSAIDTNPREYNAWRLLAENPKISQLEKDVAIAKMRELDPFNSSLGRQ